MAAHRDFAIVLGAAVALFVGYGSLQLLPQAPAPKARATVVTPSAPEPKVVASEPIVPVVVTPISVVPLSTINPDNGTLNNQTDPVKLHVKPTSTRSHVKRVRIVRKEPCVGPLCALVR